MQYHYVTSMKMIVQVSLFQIDQHKFSFNYNENERYREKLNFRGEIMQK